MFLRKEGQLNSPDPLQFGDVKLDKFEFEPQPWTRKRLLSHYSLSFLICEIGIMKNAASSQHKDD